MDEFAIVSSIIDKLTLSWKDFKCNLKHQNKNLSLKELANHLSMEKYHKQGKTKKVLKITNNETNIKIKA